MVDVRRLSAADHMTAPAQKPGKSVQDVGTPRGFLDAVEKCFGPIAFDLAANADNRVVDAYFGPGSQWGEDAFKQIWHFHKGIQWLNPPFANIGDWAMRAAAESGHGAHILMLIPAAVGTNYFREWIWPFARIYALSPRLTFVGHTQSYPKDLILCEYSRDVVPALECWRWKGK
jgi:phage N-6-adenine-methyltransferase